MKNLLIVYPGGCGGNHMANIISTNNKFTQLFSGSDYNNYLLLEYKKLQQQILMGPGKNLQIGDDEVKGIKIHLSMYGHLNQLKNNREYTRLVSNPTINILFGHEHCYHEVECSEFGKQVSRLPDKFWLIMTYPSQDTVAYNRIQLYNFDPDEARYTYPFYVDYGRSTDFAYADHTNSLLVDTDKFVDINGSKYLRELLKTINVELPDFADTLHDIWIKKIIDTLDLYNSLPTKYKNELPIIN